MEGPRPLGDFIPKVMREIGVRPANKLEAVHQAWSTVAGTLATQARVGTLLNGVLTLLVESPTLRYEIESLRQTEFIPKLQAILTDRAVTRLKCVLP